MLHITCDKCGRSGRYRVTTLAEAVIIDGKLSDWLYEPTRDCPRRQSLADACAAQCPGLLGLAIEDASEAPPGSRNGSDGRRNPVQD